MYHVLIAVDEEVSEPNRFVDAVASFPEAEDNVEATALNVFKGVNVTGEGGKFDSEDIYDEESIPQTLQDIQHSLEERGIAVAAERRHGNPAEEILSAAIDHDADVIVIGGRKRTPVGKAVFGSVSQTVLLEADRPVLSVIAE